MMHLRLALIALATFSIVLISTVGQAEEGGVPVRVPGTIVIEGNPDGLPEYAVVRAFENLSFTEPTWIGHPQDGTDRLYVAERGGRLHVFDNQRTVKKASLALDIRKQVSTVHNEEGLLGVAFDPQFESNHHAYLYYSAVAPRRTVLARFTTTGSRKYFSKRSEQLVLRVRQPEGNHNGGSLAFGPDGMLFVSVGDGGRKDDPDGHAQSVETWLGAILRVDPRAKNRFNVPADNPMQGIARARKEIWAYGFCDARKLSFDAVTGALWVGDAGQGRFEEINIVQRGGNHGWNVREGSETFADRRALTPLVDPILALPRSESRRIVGGVVYRGKRLPGLTGAYIFGDHETGSIWALRHDGAGVKGRRRIGHVTGVTHFGTDLHGELLMTSYDGNVYTLAPWSERGAEKPFPHLLSDTGLFTSTKTLTPHPSLVPYDINVPLWSDGANKERYVMLPGLEKIQVDRDGKYAFPVGTIFVKHFYFGAGAASAPDSRLLETRLMIRNKAGWVGYAYVWDDDRSDARLIDGRLTRTFSYAGKERTWVFPGRSDCTSCHTGVAGDIIGFRAEQLGGAHSFPGTDLDQREAFVEMGLFAGKHRRSQKPWPDWRAEDGDLDKQVRAYLDVNCAMCHQPQGAGNASIDLRYDTPLKKTNLVDRRPGMWDLGVYDARLIAPGDVKRSMLHVRMERTDIRGMPTIAHGVADEKALKRVRKWIEQLK